MTDKIKEIRDRVEQDVAKGPANKEIYRVHKDRAFLLAEVDRLRRHVDALQEKVSAESCACGYDSPDAVCLAHSPQLSAALADVERLTRERDEARAEVDWLRAENKRLFEEVERIDDLFLSREKTLFTQRCEIERLRADRVHRIDLRAEAWEEGWFARDCQKSDWNENPYRGGEGNERHN